MLKRAYIAADPVDAQMVRGFLQAQGIDAVIKGEFAWSARGETPVTDDTAPAVWVDESRLDEARRLIEARDEETGADWQCRNCGEVLEGQFSQCWRCGTNRQTTGCPSG